MQGTSPAQFLEHAGSIASYYGFRPLRHVDPALYKSDVGRGAISFSNASLMCANCAVAKENGPVLAYWASTAPTHLPTGVLAREAGEFGLQVSGASQSIGEIVVLKTVTSILSDWGAPIARVRINAFGDKDSRERFARELGAFARKRLGHELEGLSEEKRAEFLAHPLTMYSSGTESIREILREAPRPVHFLSERSRTHFKELLEYLEQVGLNYELDDTLGGDEREPRVAFRIDLSEGDAMILASSGGRYDDFVARLAGKRESASVHASIFFRKKGTGRIPSSPATQIPPKMYFIQLGTRAKLQSLAVVDMLRRAHIPVAQSFDAQSLAPQLAAANQTGVPYVLIMGQREALDGTVIIRSMRNSSQQIVQLGLLPKYLKTLRV